MKNSLSILNRNATLSKTISMLKLPSSRVAHSYPLSHLASCSTRRHFAEETRFLSGEEVKNQSSSKLPKKEAIEENWLEAMASEEEPGTSPLRRLLRTHIIIQCLTIFGCIIVPRKPWLPQLTKSSGTTRVRDPSSRTEFALHSLLPHHH